MANPKLVFSFLLISALMVGLLAWMFTLKNATPELKIVNEDSTPVEVKGPYTEEEQKVINPSTNTMNPKAVFTTNRGVIELELFEDKMPITVGNFTKLIDEGFYNQTKFHRVIAGFMIQGGDSNSKGANESIYGQGGPGYTIQDEFVADPELTNVRGTIAMANTGQPNSGGSQFFINLANNDRLDFDKQPLSSKHPVFGRVVSGMDVVDAIATTETKAGDLPVDQVIIEKVEVIRN